MFNSNRLLCLFSANKTLIAGNWKSNFTSAQAVDFVNTTIAPLKFNPNNVDVIISPTFLHIPAILALNPQKKSNYKVAAQNCSNYGFGAYTGEISPKHLADIGLEWVILGHSQRRTLMGEKNDLIVSKTKLAIENGLKTIYCFGQTLEERKANKTWDVLDSQITPLIEALPKDSPHWYSNIVLAYEPVWAIGTGISSTPEQTLQVVSWLRTKLTREIGRAEQIRILYGGSVIGENGKLFLGIKGLNGLLVGGASMKPQFADIVRAGDELHK